MAIVKLLENSALKIRLLTKVLCEDGLQHTRGRWKENEKLVRKFLHYLCYLAVAKCGRPLLLGDTLDSEVNPTLEVFVKEAGWLQRR